MGRLKGIYILSEARNCTSGSGARESSVSVNFAPVFPGLHHGHLRLDAETVGPDHSGVFSSSMCVTISFLFNHLSDVIFCFVCNQSENTITTNQATSCNVNNSHMRESLHNSKLEFGTHRSCCCVRNIIDNVVKSPVLYSVQCRELWADGS